MFGLIFVLLFAGVNCDYLFEKAVEHNYSRSWIVALESISYPNHTYPNISYFWELMDEESTESPLNPIIERRMKSACGTYEAADCGDPRSCEINQLPPRLWSYYDTHYPPNRAHYRCNCKNGLPPVDQIIKIEDKVYNLTRSIVASCPKVSACEKCDKEHTIKCVELADGRAMCICDPDYMEDKNCARKKDGCLESHPAATLTGKQACLDDGQTNNTCYPVPQSLRYFCVCREPYREDRRLSFPNCMDNRTLCNRPLCLGFQPPTTNRIPGPTLVLDQSYELDNPEEEGCNNTFCDCPDGWTGPHCTEKRGEPILGSWSPWSACSPDCIMPNERSRFRRSEDLHAGSSRATPMGFRSKFSRCTLNDYAYCVGTYRFWRRCRVTTLCSAWTNERLSTVVNEAIGQAMIEHDKAHRSDHIEPITTTAAKLTWSEQHALNFITVAGALIFSSIAIWILEIHHLIIYWNQEEA